MKRFQYFPFLHSPSAIVYVSTITQVDSDWIKIFNISTYNINTETKLAFASVFTAKDNLFSESWPGYIDIHNRKQSEATSTQQTHLQNTHAVCRQCCRSSVLLVEVLSLLYYFCIFTWMSYSNQIVGEKVKLWLVWLIFQCSPVDDVCHCCAGYLIVCPL